MTFRQEVLKWNGWGYKDSKFEVDPKTMMFRFTGERYKIGSHNLPLFRKWVETTLGVDLSHKFHSKVSFICLSTCSFNYSPVQYITVIIIHSRNPRL